MDVLVLALAYAAIGLAIYRQILVLPIPNRTQVGVG